MSDDIDGIVETSLNVGVIRPKGNKLSVMILIRSLHDDGRLQVEEMLSSLFGLAGASINFSGGYPGWKPDTSSPVMQLVRDTYQDLFDKVPDVMVIHAGLECGLFKTAYPHLDMVSIGPTIKFPHSPDEKILVPTVELYWQLLVKVLGNISTKS
jgi:dipeptidase D